MKITAFDFITHFGGAQRAIIDALGKLKAHNIDPSFIDAYNICPEHSGLCEKCGVEKFSLLDEPKFPVIGSKGNKLLRVWRFLRAAPELFKIVCRLKTQLATMQPDIVMVYTPKALDILLRTVGSSKKFKIIYWCHGRNIPPVIKKRGQESKVDHYLCLSETNKRLSVELGYEATKISVVSNSMDFDTLADKAKSELTGELPATDAAVKCLIPATLLVAKGQSCAIKAIGRLVEQNRDVHLWLAGDCGTDGDSYRDELENLAKSCGAAENVHFLGWRTDIPQILSRCDFLLLPSHTEGMPLCIMEAMALGVVSAATRVGSIPEMLDNGKCGILFEIDDDKTLADQLAQAIDSQERTKIMADTAYNRCKSIYSAENQIKCLTEAINILDIE